MQAAAATALSAAAVKAKMLAQQEEREIQRLTIDLIDLQVVFCQWVVLRLLSLVVNTRRQFHTIWNALSWQGQCVVLQATPHSIARLTSSISN